MPVTPSELKFGVELEVVMRSRPQVAEAVRTVVGGHISRSGDNYDSYYVNDTLGRQWRIMRDSSLDSVQADYQAEVVTPPLMLTDLPQLLDIVNAVRNCGARADHTCGMHVHVDASRFDGRTLANLCRLVYSHEPHIMKALGVSPRRQERYTKPMPPELVRLIRRHKPQQRNEMQTIWYPAMGSDGNSGHHYDCSRYFGLNLHSVFYRGTFELRYFAGTLRPEQVKAYVQFALALGCKALNARNISMKRREVVDECDKNDFRCFLVHLGMNGNQYREAREVLLSQLHGEGRNASARILAATPQLDPTDPDVFNDHDIERRVQRLREREGMIRPQPVPRPTSIEELFVDAPVPSPRPRMPREAMAEDAPSSSDSNQQVCATCGRAMATMEWILTNDPRMCAPCYHVRTGGNRG